MKEKNTQIHKKLKKIHKYTKKLEKKAQNTNKYPKIHTNTFTKCAKRI